MKIMRNIIKCMMKDNLVPGFLNSIILHHRLSKISREIHALGIEDNILSNLNVWDLANERNYWMNCNSFMDRNIATDCNANSSMTMFYNMKEQVKCRKNIKPLAINDVYCDRSIEHIQTTSEYRTRKHRQLLDSSRSSLPQKGNNSNYSTYGVIRPQNYNTDKVHRSFNEKSCNTKSKEVWTISRLKIIVSKMYLDDYDCPTFSKSIITHLSVPCKPNNLIDRIFEADPSLIETCLIVMKRKFEASMYNICSCLNDIIRKLHVRFTKTLYLKCKIYSGYISFKLKTNEPSSVNKCLFVARMPVCQNVRKPNAFQQNISSYKSKPNTEVEKSKCIKHCKNNDNNFNAVYIDEENKEKLYDTCYSPTDRSLVKDMAANVSERKTRNNSRKEIACKIEDIEDISEYIQDSIISSCKSCENIIQETSNMTLNVDNFEEKSEEDHKVLDSIEINYDDDAEKHKKEILDWGNLIMKNDSIQLVNEANCICSSYENLIEMDNKIENNFNKDSFLHITDINEHDCICLSDKESNLENEMNDYYANTCSISSFVQNFDDKQLVELNCNCFSNNNIKAIDTQETDSSLNSAKVEIGCDSKHFCRHDDFVYVTIVDNNSKEDLVCTFEASQDDLNSVKTRNMIYPKTIKISSEINNSLTISVQMPELKLSSQSIDMNKSHPRTIVQLTYNDRNASTIMKTRDKCNETADSSVLITPKKENQILHAMNKKIFNVSDKTYVIKRPEKFTESKGSHQSNGSSNKSNISKEKFLHMEDHSICVTCGTSRYCRSFAMTREFMTDDKRNEFQKFRKSRKLSKLRGYRHASSSNGIRNVTSFETILRRHRDNDYSVDTRPQTILMMTKFRDSIDRSIKRIKRLIHTKLGKILFNNRIKMTNTWNIWRNEESSEDTTKGKTSGSCIKQDYSTTSCSTSDCCKQSCIISSREFSNVILSSRKNRGKERSKGIKLASVCDNEIFPNFRLIKTPSWFYDLRIPISKNLEEWKLNRNNQSRYNRKEKIENKRKHMNYNKNSNQCDFRNNRTKITISSESTEISFIENDPKYFERYTCKQQKGTRDNKCYKQIYNRNRRYGNKKLYQETPIEYISDTSNKYLRTSLSYT